MTNSVVLGPCTLWYGDCLKALRGMADNSVDAVVTDPPYGLKFMGKHWDYDVPGVDVWRECLRVLKPGGHLLAFAGTRTQHRMAVNIEDAGFEIRDMIAWVYGSGFPKSKNLDGDRQGWGTALKPALEPITVARKPLVGTVAANVLAHGTGALNIDGCRVGDFQNTTPSGVDRRNEKLAELGYRPGTYQMGAKIPDTPPGRWPANLIHDGSEEVIALFPDSKGQQAAVGPQHGEKASINTYGDYGPRTQFEPRGDTGSAARFFYCAKANKKDRNEGTENLPPRAAGMVSNTSGQHITRRDEGYEPKPQGNHHPTVKPTDLMRYLCRLVTPPGGVVLDPFMGSGSTGKAAVREGLAFVGVERDADYFKIAAHRIRAELEAK